MAEENISQKFRLKNINETKSFFIKEIEQNELMSKKHKNVCATFNFIEYFLILGSAVTGCFSVSAVASLLVISIGILISAIRLKICAIPAGIKNYKTITKKKKKTQDKIVFLAKTILNITEVLISKGLIDSNISHDEFVSINNMVKEYDIIKEKLKNL